MIDCEQTVIVKPVSPLSLYREPGMFQHLLSSQQWEGAHFHPRFSKVETWAQEGKVMFIIAKLGCNPDLPILSPEPFIVTIWSPSARRQAGELRHAKEAIYKLAFGVGFSVNWGCLYPEV